MENKLIQDSIAWVEDAFFGDDFADEEAIDSSSGGKQCHGYDSMTMGNRELARLRSRLVNDGFREGLDAGVEEALQEGFEQGYAQGMTAGWETGSLYGAAAALAAASAGVQRTGSVEGLEESKGLPSPLGPNVHDTNDAVMLGRATQHISGASVDVCESAGRTHSKIGDLETLVRELRIACLSGPVTPSTVVNMRAKALRILGEAQGGSTVVDSFLA